MKNILRNSRPLFINLLPGNRLTQEEVKKLQNFYSEINSQFVNLYTLLDTSYITEEVINEVKEIIASW